MIRRGLQILILVGITALGAAPVYAIWSTPPGSLVVMDVGTINGVNMDGLYVLVGIESQTSQYQRWGYDGEVGTGAALQYELWDDADGVGGFGALRLRQGVTQVRATSGFSWDGSYPFEKAFSTTNPSLGKVVFYQTAAGPDAEYAAAFPDWSSAAEKIPLGFGFAMAFWASAVAASVAMKWVRDLASAAS